MSKPGKGWTRVRPANYQIEPKPGRGEANLGPSRAVGSGGAGWAQLTAGLRQLPKTQRVCKGGSPTPGRYTSPVSHGRTPVLLGWGLRTGEMLQGSFAFCVRCRNVPLPPPPLPGVILLGTQGTHRSLLGIFTSLVQVSGNMRGICR